MRLAITDVAYHEDVARAACILADSWDADRPIDSFVALRTPVADYVPGAFWQRELPVLLTLLEGVKPDIVIVDGYVWLDAEGRKGLGAHLYDALGAVIVGVAKQSFNGGEFAHTVVRGTSNKALWVTAVGMDPAIAAAHVLAMHGEHRIPTLLAAADRLARRGDAP